MNRLLCWWITRRERRKMVAACELYGGHYWHPDPKSMTGWFCCQCPLYEEGFPPDGPGEHADCWAAAQSEHTPVRAWWLPTR